MKQEEKIWRTYKLKLTDSQVEFLDTLKYQHGINKCVIMSDAISEFINAYQDNLKAQAKDKYI